MYIAVAKSLSKCLLLPHIFVKCRVGKLLAKFTVGVSITRPALNNGMWFFYVLHGLFLDGFITGCGGRRVT